MNVKSRNTVRVSVVDQFGPNPWDKNKALRLQEEKLLPAVREGKTIVYDFDGVRRLSQSFAGALVGALREELRAEFRSRVRFENTTPVVDSVLSLAASF